MLLRTLCRIRIDRLIQMSVHLYVASNSTIVGTSGILRCMSNGDTHTKMIFAPPNIQAPVMKKLFEWNITVDFIGKSTPLNCKMAANGAAVWCGARDTVAPCFRTNHYTIHRSGGHIREN